jgi:Ubiquitin 3 binding protein But2 C-terminal domain
MLMRFATPHDMSHCAFHLAFPTRLALTRSHRLLTLEDAPSFAPTPALEIYALDVAEHDLANATWAARPARGALLGRVTAAFGTNATTQAFACAEGAAVEVACVDAGCRVEYYEQTGSPAIGASERSCGDSQVGF